LDEFYGPFSSFARGTLYEPANSRSWSKLPSYTFNLDFDRRATKDRRAGRAGKTGDWFAGETESPTGIDVSTRRGRENLWRPTLFLDGFLKRRKRPMALWMRRMVPWLSFAALKRDAAAHEILGPKDHRAEMRGGGLDFIVCLRDIHPHGRVSIDTNLRIVLIADFGG
jgi:hypothetical protein